MMRLMIAAVLAFAVWGAVAPQASAGERPFVAESFQEIVKEAEGKPLIINFWSYDCPPCLAEMPMLDSFAREYPDVALVLVSTDPWDNMKRIRRVLRDHGAGSLESWVFSDPFVEKIRFSVDSKWRGELPRTYLIDQKGERQVISGMVHKDRLLQWYEQQMD